MQLWRREVYAIYHPHMLKVGRPVDRCCEDCYNTTRRAEPHYIQSWSPAQLNTVQDIMSLPVARRRGRCALHTGDTPALGASAAASAGVLPLLLLTTFLLSAAAAAAAELGVSPPSIGVCNESNSVGFVVHWRPVSGAVLYVLTASSYLAKRHQTHVPISASPLRRFVVTL